MFVDVCVCVCAAEGLITDLILAQCSSDQSPVGVCLCVWYHYLTLDPDSQGQMCGYWMRTHTHTHPSSYTGLTAVIINQGTVRSQP